MQLLSRALWTLSSTSMALCMEVPLVLCQLVPLVLCQVLQAPFRAALQALFKAALPAPCLVAFLEKDPKAPPVSSPRSILFPTARIVLRTSATTSIFLLIHALVLTLAPCHHPTLTSKSTTSMRMTTFSIKLSTKQEYRLKLS